MRLHKTKAVAQLGQQIIDGCFENRGCLQAPHTLALEEKVEIGTLYMQQIKYTYH